MNEKIVYIVQLYEDYGDTFHVYPEKIFLTEEAAEEYAYSRHPNWKDGFDYRWPDDGTETFRSYWIEPIVLEEK